MKKITCGKYTILNILTRYCVFDTDNKLLVMRPYQIVATERIINRIETSTNYKKLGTTEESHCYGFYASRFRTHHLFHSVPINEKATKAEKGHSMCDMHKYEKLGTVASDGCVRLTVADAKWIYDFSETGKVTVKIIKDKGPAPSKPPAVIWEEPYTDKNGYGWDPTDPDPDNPYHLLEETISSDN